MTDRPPAPAPGTSPYVSGIFQPRLELDSGILFEEGHHLWGGFQERVCLGFIEVVAEDVPQVGARRLRILDDFRHAGRARFVAPTSIRLTRLSFRPTPVPSRRRSP